MTRQIEINFYADNIAGEDQQSIAGDLFDVSSNVASKSMHLDNSAASSETATISADDDENKDYLFNDQ